MTHDGKPPWLTDAKVVGRFALLNFLLICVGMCCWGGVLDRVGAVWFWVFAFPGSAAAALVGWGPVPWVLLALNPLIYGVMWWFVWKMVRLMRPKVDEDGSPPLHNE